MPTPACSTAARTAGSSFCQPVVPTTRLMPRPASTGAFDETAAGVEKSMATSMPSHRAERTPSVPAAERLSMIPATSHPYSPASEATRCPIRPWPTSRIRIARTLREQWLFPVGALAAEECAVEPVHRLGHIAVAQYERDVAPRRRLRHQPERNAPERVDGTTEHRWICSQVLADGADNRHVRLAPHFGERPQVVDDRIEPPCVVDGHRHA